MSLWMWDVNDALRVTARFTDWLASPDATRLTRGHIWANATLPDDVDRAEMAEQSNADLAAGLRVQEPIWVDPAMVDLLAASSGVLPPVEVEPWHFPHPRHGIVIFAKPLPADWMGIHNLNTGEDTATDSDEISAITWEAPFVGKGWIVRAWARSAPPHLYRLPSYGIGTVRCPDLRPCAVIETVGVHLGGEATRVLVALAALTRTSSNVAETRETGSKAARKVAEKYRMATPTVRRLYLNRPEAGAAELDAVRAHRAGTPRGHWVRGHWRNQWHPSIEEHRWHWIDGFPRGDFARGIVEGPRVQVARGRVGDVPPSSS